MDHDYVYNVDRILMLDSTTSTVNNSYCWSNGTAGGEHRECIYNGGGENLTAKKRCASYSFNERRAAAIFYDNPDYGGSGSTGTLDASRTTSSRVVASPSTEVRAANTTWAADVMLVGH